MSKLINIILLILFLGFSSCEEYFEPRKGDNTIDEEEILRRPQYAEGLLMHAYSSLPDNYVFYSDVATDDAVTNVLSSSYSRMAQGEWTSEFYPGATWNNSFEEIFYINKFLGLYESVTYAFSPLISDEDNVIRDALHKKRLRGEAHGLRAWYKFQLLRNHSGKAADGTLLGFPIVDRVVNSEDAVGLPRNTYIECFNSILEDLDIAIAELPAVYQNTGDPNTDDAFGSRFENRITGKAARALKSRVTLHAASPAFSEGSNITWEQAATVSGDLLVELGPLYSGGTTFYESDNNKEIIWDRSIKQINSWEANNFPPSLFGSGETNPSQNLVDAFPMKNGYPIDHELSGYDPDDPYANRDSRLSDYIIYNGALFKNEIISTYQGADLDGIREQETSTLSGYYLRKFMNESVSLTPGSTADATQSFTIFRETEVHLNYAEAANEAWGPDGDPNGYGFTARTIIRDLRARAGVEQPDAYLASITTREDMRTLIRNERRLELCFEDFRFWDIRRWNDITTMQKPVKGVYITYNPEGEEIYDYRDIEQRVFDPHMIYGPVPFNELRFGIQQNLGW